MAIETFKYYLIVIVKGDLMRKIWKYAALGGIGLALLAKPTGVNNYGKETQPMRTWQSKADERRESAEYNLSLIRYMGKENTDRKALEYGLTEGLYTKEDIAREENAYRARGLAGE